MVSVETLTLVCGTACRSLSTTRHGRQSDEYRRRILAGGRSDGRRLVRRSTTSPSSSASATSTTIGCCARPPSSTTTASASSASGRRMAEAAAADRAQRAAAARRRPRARAEGRGGREGAEAYRSGVELIHKQLEDILRKRGVRPIEALGADFDPNYPPGRRARAGRGPARRRSHRGVRRGYMLGDRLLRPAMVKVAKGAQ